MDRMKNRLASAKAMISQGLRRVDLGRTQQQQATNVNVAANQAIQVAYQQGALAAQQQAAAGGGAAIGGADGGGGGPIGFQEVSSL